MSLRTQVFICVKVRQTSWTTSPKQFVINDRFESLLLNLLTIGSPRVTLIGIGKLLLVIGAWLPVNFLVLCSHWQYYYYY